jgi:hypothetical protein
MALSVMQAAILTIVRYRIDVRERSRQCSGVAIGRRGLGMGLPRDEAGNSEPGASRRACRTLD